MNNLILSFTDTSNKSVINNFLIQNNAVLVGSRYYGTHNKNSDYDYLVIASKQLWQNFPQCFERVSGIDCDYEEDAMTIAVYSVAIDGVKIDLQVAANLQTFNQKINIYRFFKQNPMLSNMPKFERNQLFVYLINNYNHDNFKAYNKPSPIL